MSTMRRGIGWLGLLPLRAVLIARGLVLRITLLGCLLLQRDFFDAEYYLRTYKGGRRLRFAMLRYAFSGAGKLRDPNAWFSQVSYLTEHPEVCGRGSLPVLHYLLFDPAGRHLNGRTGLRTTRPGYDRFSELWPMIQADMMALRDVERHLSGAPLQGQHLMASKRYPGPAVIGRPLGRLIDSLPAQIDHMLIVPWLGISGGSERISQRLIAVLREHYGRDRMAVIGPDVSFDLKPEQRDAYGVPIVAFGDVSPRSTRAVSSRVSAQHGMEVLDRLLVHFRPRTLHCINSGIGWRTLQERGRYYSQDSKIFGNIYSDVRFNGGLPAGAFWSALPDCLDFLAGVFADNATVVRKAQANFGLLPEEMTRFHVLYTPVLGEPGGHGRLRPYRPGAPAHSLWMSRIAVEKRLDLVAEIAQALPDRRFSIYGATIAGALPVNMAPLQAQPNIAIQGAYRTLDDVPFDDFDSYLFTTTAEGLPIALLEAAQYGLPLVAPDIGGIGEFVDPTTGWLVPSDGAVAAYVAALEDIRRRPEEAGRRVAAAQSRLAERHSWAAFRAGLYAVPGYLNGARVAPPADTPRRSLADA